MTIKKFVKEFALIANDSELLYSDLIDQEQLFEMQEKILNLLLLAHKDSTLSADDLLQFNFVFGTTNK
jgi:hypothetical protein